MCENSTCHNLARAFRFESLRIELKAENEKETSRILEEEKTKWENEKVPVVL